jgi:formate dehydrogenase subunit gamma
VTSHVKERDVRRFTTSEIVFHWAQAIPYLVLLTTGAVLFGERIFEFELVTKTTLIDVHRIAGIALPVCILLAFLGGDRSVLLRNLRLGTRFGRADFDWLRLLPLKRFRPEIELPPAGKFNAGQKLNFTAQVIAVPVFFVTGLFMWFVHGQLLSWYVHVAAFFIVTPLIGGHLYMALINPSTRASITSVIHGRVNGEWARHHHSLEYDDVVIEEADERSA